ncbi:MAG TPA: PBP1A family penicillin-binding protein [Beijerinckiaceae bacterium]|nr:PBP1A family penicillin-binding protein [Beijerinckiaceae bacterium]
MARAGKAKRKPGELRADAAGRIRGGEPKRSRGPRRKGSALRAVLYWSAVSFVWCVIAAAGLVAYNAEQLPAIDQLTVPKRAPNIAILADDGTLLANRGDSGPSVRLSDLPPYLPAAFVAIEDRRFYEHWGIDPVGVLRAAVSDALGHGGLQGGSTLTQQLARNLFLTQQRTLARKIQEAILAIWLEHRFSKNQILSLYLNRVYFGSGAYGVEAAAEKYFGRSARVVTLPQAAMLAGLMKAPSKLDPDRNPRGAEQRADEVIRAMRDQGKISPAAAQLALTRPAHAIRQKGDGSVNYAADYVMDALNDRIGAIDQDVVVRTTIDPRLQAAGERALTGELDKNGGRFRVRQGALVAMDPSGAIKALIGGAHYKASQYDRAVSAKRQPGSAFKPFVYLTALERGLTPDTIRQDAPITLKGWSPEDASRRYLGPVTLSQALSMSLNTVAVRIGLEVGAKNIVATAHRLGIRSQLHPDPSIALGTSEVTPLELTTAYLPFANGGFRAHAHIIEQVRTAKGKLLYDRTRRRLRRVIQPRYVAMMNAMMEKTLQTGTARRASLPGWQAAGKTGTSQDYRDAWFLGYTADVVTGVWLGNDDSSPTNRVVGGSLPVAIWSRFMRAALKDAPPVALPDAWRAPVASPPMASNSATGLFRFLASGSKPPQATSAKPRQIYAAAPMRERRSVRGLMPPANVPNSARGVRYAPRRKNFFETLFGG